MLDEQRCVRDLCRNPRLPARLMWCRVLSLGYTSTAPKTRQTLMNTARSYHSAFFGIMSPRTGARFDVVEVRSSSHLVPTIFLTASPFDHVQPWHSRIPTQC